VPRKPRFKWAILPVFAVLVASLTGCSSEQISRGFLPGVPGVTNHTDRIVSLWNGSWIILLAVGIIAWGLMFWAIIVYRRRKGDREIPPQLRYNMPIETLFTVVPLILVVGFFVQTTIDMNAIEKKVDSDYRVEVIGKQWSWDFNYTNDNVYDSGLQLPENQSEAELPVLYLPVNKSVEIDLVSRDVIHSFWVIDFLYKKDVFPGFVNKMYVTPQVIGDYKGKCAELCGEYHSAMLFNVKVVSEADYKAHMARLAAAGNTGQLTADPNDPDNLNRNGNLPGDNPEIRG
jgi:cytochrome c oxidase subunit 2